MDIQVSKFQSLRIRSFLSFKLDLIIDSFLTVWNISVIMTGFLKKKNAAPLAVYDGVAEGLKEIYKKKLLPLEKDSKFHEIQSPMMEDPDFDGKPLVMLIGQYSTGKTTFIR